MFLYVLISYSSVPYFSPDPCGLNPVALSLKLRNFLQHGHEMCSQDGECGGFQGVEFIVEMLF